VYGAKLEIASPRFSQRADFFAYICFVCVVILVSRTSVIIFLLLPMRVRVALRVDFMPCHVDGLGPYVHIMSKRFQNIRTYLTTK
jgi:hypothetical protein